MSRERMDKRQKDALRVWERWFAGWSENSWDIWETQSVGNFGFGCQVQMEARFGCAQGSHLARSMWSVSLEDMRRKRVLMEKGHLENGNIGRLLKMSSRHAMTVLCHLVAEILGGSQEDYVCGGVVLKVSRSGSVLGGFLPTLKG